MGSAARWFLGPVLALGLCAGVSAADYLVLKDGRRIEGKILAEDAKEVRIKTNVGEVAFARSEIVELKREKTRDEVYAERLAACASAEDFYQLGLWCEEHKQKKRAEGVYEKALERDADHAGARAKLGFVRHADTWMTPAERDRRVAEELAAAKRAQGLVEHEGQWVTPEEAAKLQAGWVRVDGTWLPRDQALARQGLMEHKGELVPLERGLALCSAEEFAALAPRALNLHVGERAALFGDLPPAELEHIALELVRTRAWFDGAYGLAGDAELFGGRLPEFYAFGRGAEDLYRASVAFAAGRSAHVPESWAGLVERGLGFLWFDPISMSSARQGPRGAKDLAGHCYHHMGHLMVERLGYDGRLLPPWYVEGVAALAEARTHAENYVFCRASLAPATGTQAGAVEETISERVMRDGAWRLSLRGMLERGQEISFDRLAQLEFSQLQMADIAQAMSIVEWLEERPGALPRFHAELRKHAPPAPERVLRARPARKAAHDAAFGAAMGLDERAAGTEWRLWFLSR